jgi:hypothetical protein
MSDKLFYGILLMSLLCSIGVGCIAQFRWQSLVLTGGVAILAMVFFMFFFTYLTRQR